MEYSTFLTVLELLNVGDRIIEVRFVYPPNLAAIAVETNNATVYFRDDNRIGIVVIGEPVQLIDTTNKSSETLATEINALITL